MKTLFTGPSRREIRRQARLNAAEGKPLNVVKRYLEGEEGGDELCPEEKWYIYFREAHRGALRQIGGNHESRPCSAKDKPE